VERVAEPVKAVVKVGVKAAGKGTHRDPTAVSQAPAGERPDSAAVICSKP